jgi:hypothetical protein
MAERIPSITGAASMNYNPRTLRNFGVPRQTTRTTPDPRSVLDQLATELAEVEYPQTVDDDHILWCYQKAEVIDRERRRDERDQHTAFERNEHGQRVGASPTDREVMDPAIFYPPLSVKRVLGLSWERERLFAVWCTAALSPSLG